MAEARITQPSFTAGEISEALYGRKDLSRYQVGAKKVQNCFVHAHGGVSNRAGLRFAAEVKDSAKQARLMTFESASDEAFLLVWGDLNVRPMFRGGYVDAGGGIPVEVVTPFRGTTANNDLPDIYMEQSNDIASVVHPLYAPRELARFSATNWVMSTINFTPTIPAPTGLAATATYGYTGHGTDKLPKPYTYKVATISDGGEEGLPSAAATSANTVLGYEQNFVTLTWTAPVGVTPSVYVVYKEQNGLYGYIGETPSLTFKDTNFAPSFNTGPQTGRNPLNSAGNYPSVVTYVQQRRAFAATLNRPQTTYLTKSGNFTNLGVSVPTRDDDAMEFTLASKKKQDIYHIVPLEKGMIVFTRSGEWRVAGRDGDILTPSSVVPEPQSSYGANKALRPIVAGAQLLFAPRVASSVLEMEYSIQIDRYKATDLSVLSEHLFRGRTIVAWDYAIAPYGIIWMVMSDGELISLTYLKDHDVWGFSRHDTRGRFLDVSVVPEQGRDVPYFLVRRRIGGAFKKYVEYMAAREIDDVRNAFFVDSGLSLDNPVPVTSFAFGATTTITRNAHGLANGDLVELDKVVLIDDDDDKDTSLNGAWVVAGVTTNTFRITHQYDNIDEGITAGDDLDTTALASHFYDGEAVWRKGFASISGLGHLEGRKVVALCDGNVVSDLVVTAGAVALGRRFFRVHCGLSYRAVLQTLDLVNPQGDDTGIIKATPQIFLRMLKTRGIKVGPTEETADEVYSRDYEDYGEPAAMRTGVFPISLWGTWDTEQSVALVQDYPLPMNILGVTLEDEYGGS